MIDEDGKKVESQEQIAGAAVDYFKSIFGQDHEDDYDSLVIEELQGCKQLTEQMQRELDKDVTRDEVVEALSPIGSDKAPGPDGFSAYFFQFCWRIVGDDFTLAVHNFFKSSRMLREVNSTVLTLVPKVTNPLSFSD